MRLLNTWLLELEEFVERDTPPYAILSHTWGEEEVLLPDMMKGRASSLRGYQKVLACCEQARQDGLEYVWIDTCCIDKSSSTELAESINSMFKWYRNSIVCYAYLEDIHVAEISNDPRELGDSRWWTRGWTLQELIAPSTLILYDSEWKEIGSRDDLLRDISDTTGIDRELFLHGKLSQYSVAQRMSWAARRRTTRVEDEAYCLLGLFGVSMPLLYGEGKMAFIRLQEEIMKRSDDQSIFAWTGTIAGTGPSGLLAPSPACFERAGSILTSNDKFHSSPFFITNKGIQITLPMLGCNHESALPSFQPEPSTGEGPKIVVTLPDSLKIAILSCQVRSGQRLGLILDRRMDHEQWHRDNPDMGPLSLNAEDCYKDAEMQTILVKSHEPVNDKPLRDGLRPTFFSIQGLPLPESGWGVTWKYGTTIKINRPGVVSGRLRIGNRGGVVVCNGTRAFGIFLAETWTQSCWELVAGERQDVEFLADCFLRKNEKLLSSRPLWRLLLGISATSSEASAEISMETCRRPHGFSSMIKIGERTGAPCTENVPRTMGELSKMIVKLKTISPGIGWKGRRYPDSLSKPVDLIQGFE